jgi:hypothetical protein
LNNKKDEAVRFIQEIQRMDPRQLHALISREAGEDLAQFFMSYSATLIARDPERVLQNGSSLMRWATSSAPRRSGGRSPSSSNPWPTPSELDRGRWSVLAAGLPGSC